MNSTLIIWAAITSLAQEHGIEPSLLRALIRVESNFNADAIGSKGERGLLQLRPQYFAITGNALVDLETGVEHLKTIRQTCPHSESHTWIICHNLGVAGAARIKNPKAQTYYRKVMEAYEQEKSILQVVAE